MERSFRLSVLTIPPTTAAEMTALVTTAEECGYDALWFADERFSPDPYAALGYCAARTSRIGLGVCVTDPYSRHPSLTAMAIGALDHHSSGRAILGIGAGGSGFAELGLRQVKPARAIAEAIDLIRGLLRGETVTLDGEVVHLHGGKLDFPPLRASVPVYIASQNSHGLRLAGAVADGAIMQGCLTEPMLRFFTTEVRAGAEAAGRSPGEVEMVARIDVVLGDDRHEAVQRAKPNIARSLLFQKPEFRTFKRAGIEVPDSLQALIAPLPVTRDPAVTVPVAKHVPDEWVEAFVIAGDPPRVAAQVRSLLDRGIDHFILRPVARDGDEPAVVRRFAREVLPLIRRQAGSRAD